ncbi:glycosyltransferase [Sulfurovum riftiae]|uniref:Glycosyl transferase family 1 domain-containing protein n=1 Tax=Sulfurovum riftiae TaxID=1630136 RepID=A0A151CIJ0_9BACT|nr:glycosyltransferase [Sulfurovum riftiae]KYJ87309.1 hypothetical protein AS592_09290 [Sulfurovum riftiae]
MSKLVLLQTVATDYRKKLFDTLEHNLKDNFILFAGEYYFEKSVKTDNTISYLHKIKNVYFLNRKFLFQFGMWRESLKTENLIIEMNPRILSNWVLLLLRKVLGKRTILWGHAWPRNGKNSRSDQVRQKMRQLGDVIITYTKTQAIELQEKMPNKKIIFAPNSLYYKDEMFVAANNSIDDIIYVGRLTTLKKPKLLIEAYSKVINKLPKSANLIIVGDGEEFDTLKHLIHTRGLEKKVQLLGHIGDYDKLEKLYRKSLFSVSPGYVGLSITQSFSFGVPMLISKDENHSPEIEAAKINENSVFFETDNVENLAKKILTFYENKNSWIKKRKEISRQCQENYSIESMAKTFLDIL